MLALQGTRHEPVAEAHTTLYLSTQHPDARIRLLAVRKLLASVGADAAVRRADARDLQTQGTYPLAS